MTFPATDISAFVSSVLASCLDIRSVWSTDHCPDQSRLTPARHELLAFADAATLERLRRCEYLHRADIEFLVVVDGDLFESRARGPASRSRNHPDWLRRVLRIGS